MIVVLNKYIGNKCNFKIIFFNCEAIRLETRMPDNPFFAEYVIGIYNFLEIESSLLESIQNLNFRLGIGQIGLKTDQK